MTLCCWNAFRHIRRDLSKLCVLYVCCVCVCEERDVKYRYLTTIVRPRLEVLTQTVNNFETRAGTGLKLGPFKSLIQLVQVNG